MFKSKTLEFEDLVMFLLRQKMNIKESLLSVEEAMTAVLILEDKGYTIINKDRDSIDKMKYDSIWKQLFSLKQKSQDIDQWQFLLSNEGIKYFEKKKGFYIFDEKREKIFEEFLGKPLVKDARPCPI